MDENGMKMIEEMASIICKETSNKGLCEKCDFKKHEQFGYTYQCHKFDNAETLYNANCRIIADDEIVIKKSEYEDLRLAKYKAMEEATEYEKTAYKQLEQANQGTREILQAINKYLVGTRGIYTVKTFRNGLFEDIMLVRADDLETLVNKLAKKHDVELED